MAEPRRLPHAGAALALALALLAGACGRSAPAPAPAGQVVARVDGVEITRRELAFELEADPQWRGLGGIAAQRGALAALVERKLLAAAAQRAQVDRDPDFLLARRRMGEQLLAARLADRLADETAVPDEAALDRFIGANPALFGPPRPDGEPSARAERRARARALIMQQVRSRALAVTLRHLRATARIAYQPGFAPPAQ